jgi:hypothetical protein
MAAPAALVRREVASGLAFGLGLEVGADLFGLAGGALEPPERLDDPDSLAKLVEYCFPFQVKVLPAPSLCLASLNACEKDAILLCPMLPAATLL